jgi:hypothetical protein
MKSIKLNLFEYRKTLTPEQSDVVAIISEHIDLCDRYSETEIYNNLEATLESYKYYENVSKFLENLETELNTDPILYSLKDLYAKINRKGDTFLYEPALKTIIECINEENTEARSMRIINDLKMYEWISEIRGFLHTLSTTPQEKQNFDGSGAKIEDVNSLAVQIEEGFLTYIAKKWVLLNDDGISFTTLEKHINNEKDLHKLRLLEQAVDKSVITNDSIEFRLADELSIKFDLNTKEIKLNDSTLETETTIESIFNSPVIPFYGKAFYPILIEAYNNLDKFVHIDIVKHVYNVINPTFECYVFKFKNKIAQYRIDKNMGESFYEFDNAMPLIENVAHDLGADLTFFYEEMLPDEVAKLNDLTNAEKQITEKIEQVDNAILLIKYEDESIRESNEVKTLLNSLLLQKHKLSTELKEIKNSTTKLKK